MTELDIEALRLTAVGVWIADAARDALTAVGDDEDGRAARRVELGRAVEVALTRLERAIAGG
jgi:hypothetical protein